jgi:hypothetical protein
MQDRYAGDVGDFGKLALLRVLAPNRRLGICWYLTDGGREVNSDGRYLGYLDRPGRFRNLDAELFDALRHYRDELRAGRRRSVESLEQLDLLPRTTLFHRALCPRASARTAWASEMLASMGDADLVFLDPDNGLEGAEPTPKRVSLDELRLMRRPGRAVLVYQHQTRRPGGADVEVAFVTERLHNCGFETVEVIRLKPYSARFYFLLDGNAALSQLLGGFAAHWRNEIRIWPASSLSTGLRPSSQLAT